MPVLYKLYKMVRTFKDGRDDKKANNHWFARAIHIKEMTTEELANSISYSTTVTPSDCLAVLKALGPAMNASFNASRPVVLDGVGRFKVGIKTTGAETAADFNISKNIQGMYINFQPEYHMDAASGRKTVDMLKGLSCQETPLNLILKD